MQLVKFEIIIIIILGITALYFTIWYFYKDLRKKRSCSSCPLNETGYKVKAFKKNNIRKNLKKYQRI